jgi:glycerol uptake facilitator protein
LLLKQEPEMAVSLLKRSIAEGIGTALLVYFGAGAAAITLMIAHGTNPSTSFNIGIGALGGLADWLAIGLSFAFVIAAVIYGMGRISGAHINPAVTIALLATKRFPSTDCGAYIAAQCIGATIGSFLFAASVGMDAVTIGGLGATAPFPTITMGQAILAEFIGTFVLMLVIMGVAVDRQAPPGFAGLVIGLTVGGIITTTGNIAGSSLNPARTLGPYIGDLVIGGNNLFGYFPIYIIGPILGAVAAAFLYDWLTVE